MSSNELADAVLTVDLAAIVANWRQLQRRVAPAECAAVVKADAYGLGAEEVAPPLEAAGCRSFYVAQLDEALVLRRALPTAEIAVFDGILPGAEAEFAAHRLIPVLNSLEQIDRWAALARGWNELPAMLHLDTGLTRLGLGKADVEQLAALPERLAGLSLRLVISHLACSEERSHPMNPEQLARFNRMRARLPRCRAALAASSGIFLGPQFHLDHVRPGAALYGVAPFPDESNPMDQVVELTTQILQVRDVDSPRTVGYGATHRVRRPSRIATAGVGYADGYFRTLSNRSLGFIGDHPAPVVGRVSMDLITLDVTEVPAELVHPGARVELLGPHRSVDQLGTDAGTNGYEVLTSLGKSKRFHRRYLGGAARV
jgi:alanine racemase